MRALPVLIIVFLLAAMPGAAQEEAESEAERILGLTYDQGFRFGDVEGDFFLRINGLLQLRYSYVDYDPLIRETLGHAAAATGEGFILVPAIAQDRVVAAAAALGPAH